MRLALHSTMWLLLSVGFGQAATLQVQAVASTSGLDISSGPVGGTDNQVISTNTAGSAASGAVTASSSTSVATSSAFASANIATGQLKASAVANPGTYYQNIPSAPVWGSEAGATAQAMFSETFVAVGSGMLTFNMAVNGTWNIAPQPYVSCCDSFGNPVSGYFQPSWLISSSIVLGSNGVLAGDQFSNVSPFDPASGSVNTILSFTAPIFDGVTYGISATLDTFLLSAIGGIDFSHTATLSFVTSPGVSLLFDDSRFLTINPNDPAPIPLPAGAVLLGSALFGLGVATARRRSKSL